MSNRTGFCTKCGAKLTEGAVFCSSCGNPVSTAVPGTGAHPFPARPLQRREKDEKGEKHEKGEREKGEDRSGAIVGGLILVWLGVSLYLGQTNIIPGTNWWAYFLTGLGAILIVRGIQRRTRTGQPLVGMALGGVVLLVIGLSGIFSIGTAWPLVLVAIGVAVIFSGLSARRRSPQP